MLTLGNFVVRSSRPVPNHKIEGSVRIITLGCDKNTVDSEQLAAQLAANGFDVVHQSEKHCPITIINTCGFISDSKLQSIETILECIEAKKRAEIHTLIVFGCLSQRYKKELEEEMPEVDAWFGVNALRSVLSYLQAEIHTQLLTERRLSTPSHYAYLKISEGCNHGCAYCAIPLIRGRHTSKPMDMILEEARILLERGCKELILVAQDLTAYGIDLYKKQSLPKLLDSLAQLPQHPWIRLHYTYPNHFPLEILDIMKEYPHICRYLDMPLQHIDDDILQSMGRHITGDEIRRLTDTIRQRIPDIALRTSLIVGYPGETKKKFQSLLSFVKETRFDRLGVFTYSHEEGTPAFQLKDSISQIEKERRKEEIMWEQQTISLEKNKEKIGQDLQVLIDSKTAAHYIGRTQYDSPEVDNCVLLSRKNKPCEIGNFHTVRITKAEDFELKGHIV